MKKFELYNAEGQVEDVEAARRMAKREGDSREAQIARANVDGNDIASWHREKGILEEYLDVIGNKSAEREGERIIREKEAAVLREQMEDIKVTEDSISFRVGNDSIECKAQDNANEELVTSDWKIGGVIADTVTTRKLELGFYPILNKIWDEFQGELEKKREA